MVSGFPVFGLDCERGWGRRMKFWVYAQGRHMTNRIRTHDQIRVRMKERMKQGMIKGMNKGMK